MLSWRPHLVVGMQIQDDAEAEAPKEPNEWVAVRLVAVVDSVPSQHHDNQDDRQNQHRRSSAVPYITVVRMAVHTATDPTKLAQCTRAWHGHCSWLQACGNNCVQSEPCRNPLHPGHSRVAVSLRVGCCKVLAHTTKQMPALACAPPLSIATDCFKFKSTWQGLPAPTAGAGGFAAQAWRLDIHAVVVVALLPSQRVRTSPHRVAHRGGGGWQTTIRLRQEACCSRCTTEHHTFETALASLRIPQVDRNGVYMCSIGQCRPHAPPTAAPGCRRVGTVISRPVKTLPTASCLPAYARCERLALTPTGQRAAPPNFKSKRMAVVRGFVAH